jgi:hypothetical protein
VLYNILVSINEEDIDNKEEGDNFKEHRDTEATRQVVYNITRRETLEAGKKRDDIARAM